MEHGGGRLSGHQGVIPHPVIRESWDTFVLQSSRADALITHTNQLASRDWITHAPTSLRHTCTPLIPRPCGPSISRRTSSCCRESNVCQKEPSPEIASSCPGRRAAGGGDDAQAGGGVASR